MSHGKALVVRVEDRPGTLGEIASALGAHGVNLRALEGSTESGQGVVRMVVDKLADAKRVLLERGYSPEEEEVLEFELSDDPGALGEAAEALGEAGVNIKYVFVTTAGAKKATAFLAVSDIKKALKALW